MARARYLLRFDDICPTMNWRIWMSVERILIKSGVRPLLAVIPDNQDPKLNIDPPHEDFWERCRAWQKMGWSIGLHGYQHRYVTNDPGMLHSKAQSEFAGLPAGEQERKLRAGLDVFSRHGVRADAWVAPSHSFDATTVAILGQLGVPVISDGPWRWPHTDAAGLFWVPQQLPHFMPAKAGLWTVCMHHNTWTQLQASRMLTEIEAYSGQCVHLGRVVEEYHGRRKTVADVVEAVWDRTARRMEERAAVTWRRLRRRGAPVSHASA